MAVPFEAANRSSSGGRAPTAVTAREANDHCSIHVNGTITQGGAGRMRGWPAVAGLEQFLGGCHVEIGLVRAPDRGERGWPGIGHVCTGSVRPAGEAV
jgi:hypothetical protein